MANPKQAKILQRFFKTGKGEYGFGDVFLGIKVPVQRKAAKRYYDLPLGQVIEILRSKIHEHRLSALFILVHKYQKGDEHTKKRIFELYLWNLKFVNNWDLVDLSAPNIVGGYLLNRNRKILFKLVKSRNLWSRRVAILATYTFIRQNDFKDTLRLGKILLSDNHDLIHKAVGWMLREVGNRNSRLLKEFLRQNSRQMPRTALRYAIEKFDKKTRQKFLRK